MTITDEKDDIFLKIYINKILHLKINFNYIEYIHSYIDDNNIRKDIYKIEISFKNKESILLLEYENKITWIKILKILNY